MRLALFSLCIGLVAIGCSSSSSSSDESTADSDLSTVPQCTGFDLKAMVERTNDKSPDYQCEVSSGLSRSSQPTERWIKSLSDPAVRVRPFRAVVNLRGEHGANGEEPIVRQAGMTPLNIRVKDMTAPTRDQAIEFLSFVTDRDHQPALVHCKAGQGRTGTFVAIYRIAVQRWSLADAVAEAREFNVNDVQIAFVQDFATHLEDPEIKRFANAPGGEH